MPFRDGSLGTNQVLRPVDTALASFTHVVVYTVSSCEAVQMGSPQTPGVRDWTVGDVHTTIVTERDKFCVWEKRVSNFVTYCSILQTRKHGDFMVADFMKSL